MDIKYTVNEKVIPMKEIQKLYTDAGWKAYTCDIPKLKRSFENSLYCIYAWDKDKLVGALRAVGDDESIAYIQDILILNEYQRKGIGKKIIQMAHERFLHVRAVVLMTDKESEAVDFYKAVGYEDCDSVGCITFLRN